MFGSRKRNDDGIAFRRSVDENSNVAWRLIEEGQQPAVLEQAIRSFYEQELRLLLGSETRQIAPRRDRCERGNTHIHVATGGFLPKRLQRGRGGRELARGRNCRRQDDLARTGDPGERLG